MTTLERWIATFDSARQVVDEDLAAWLADLAQIATIPPLPPQTLLEAPIDRGVTAQGDYFVEWANGTKACWSDRPCPLWESMEI